MIPIRYDAVRWVILLVGAASLSTYFIFPLTPGAQMGLGFLLVLTAMSLIVPPGIYGWLVRALCPTCRQQVEWAAVQPDGAPYEEEITVGCRNCGKSKVEWAYR